jgi:hypothetical protein
VQHDLISANTLSQIQPYFEKSDQHTLVLFDVDSTLTIPSDPYLRRQAIGDHKGIYDALIKQLTANQLRIFSHVLVVQSLSQLLDLNWPTIIQKLQNTGAKTLAMTAAKMGDLGTLPSFPVWRYEALKRLGIDFSNTFKDSIVFKHLSDFGGEHPGMEQGIIYCGHQLQKGVLLKDILIALQWQPQRIILIDDKMENVRSLSEALQKDFPHIHFIGIHYRAIECLPTIPTSAAIFEKKFKALFHETLIICGNQRLCANLHKNPVNIPFSQETGFN